MDTQKKVKPTPRPWKVGAGMRGNGVPILAGQYFSHVVTRIAGSTSSDAKDLANAALIVRAVNAHDELLAVTKTTLEYLQEQLGDCDPDCDCVIHGLESAIQKAGE